MEFPALFDFEPEQPPEEKPAAVEAPAPQTALAVVTEPVAPVVEVIRDVDVLKETLDKRASQPVPLIGEDLVSNGFVTREQLEKAVEVQQRFGSVKPRIGEILVSTGLIEQKDLDFILARRLGVPSVDLRHLKISSAALGLVPKALCRQFELMPCIIHRNQIVVAMANPMDQNALKALRFACERHVLAVMAPKEDIEWAIPHYYKDVRNYKGPSDGWR